MAEPGTFEKVLGEVGQALLPLRRALQSPEQFAGFLRGLGWHVDTIPALFADLGDDLDALFDELNRIVAGGLNVGGAVRLDSGEPMDVSPDDILRVLRAVRRVVDGVRAIANAPDSATPPQLRVDGFTQVFPKQVIDHLVISYLMRYQPSVCFALRVLGVIKSTYTPAAGNRPPHVRYTLDVGDLPQVLTDPGVVLRNAFGWGEPDFDYDAFASQVDNLLQTIGVDVRIDAMPTHTATAIDGITESSDAPTRRTVRGIIVNQARPDGDITADIRLIPLPAHNGHLPGFAILPAFTGSLNVDYPLAENLTVGVRSDLDLRGGVAVLIRPGEPIGFVVGFGGTGNPSTASGSIAASIEHTAAEGDAPVVLLGAADTTRLQYRALGGSAGARIDRDGNVDVFVEFGLVGLEFVLDSSGADGFIARVLPAGGIGFATDLTVGVSHRDGFYFRGTSNLEIAIPAHLQIGPVDIESLTVSANPRDGHLPVALGATFRVALGPLRAVVENVGLSADVAFADGHDGNLGPLDLSLGFKPPKGVGLSLDAGVVTGGGYLFLDPDQGEYAGVLDLTFTDFLSLKAVGILTTRMPDGSSGYSLLILVSVEFGSGIQLGFGFTLLAVGGLLGLNRTVHLQSLMDGVRTGAIESVMFPRDIIANAPRIISDLRTLFPPQEGTFLIGPMAKLGWGTPTLVSVSLGVIIEVPGNIAAVGVLKVILPDEDARLIVLQVNFAGAIEFDRRRVYLFAALYESRVLFMPIDGELGVLAAWGDDPNFVVSAGGFHPRFTAPALPFPSPRRLAVTLLNTPAARLSAQGYVAVTSNSVQFGARVSAFFGFDELNVNGHLALDVLLRFSPFYFIVDFSASFSVRVFGFGLFSVHVRGSLEGPDPWHIRGRGSLSILWWDFHIPIDVTWGEDRDNQLPPVPVLPILTAALNQADNWRVLAPPASRGVVSLRALPGEEAGRVLDPNGVLRVSQRALPLELTLQRVGNQRPSDVNRLSVSVGAGGLVKRSDVDEQFAPAQFQDYTDAERLSRPAFGPQRAGLELSAGGAETRSSVMVKRAVRYEEVILDANFIRLRTRYQPFSATLFGFFVGGGAAALSPRSQATARRYQPFDDKVSVSGDTYTVAHQSTNRAYAPASFSSEASAREFVAAAVATDPALADTIHVIPTFESVP